MKIQIQIFSIIIFLISVTNELKSQSQERDGISLGIESGFQFTDISDTYMPSKGGIGYNMGIFGEYPFNELIKLRIGLLYDHRAFNLNSTQRLGDTSGYQAISSYYAQNIDYKVNYLTIPLSLLYMKGSGRVKLYFQFSFYYSLLINAKRDGMIDLYISEEDAPHFSNPDWKSEGHRYTTISGDNSSEFNSYDMGLNFHMGVIFQINDQLGLSFSPAITYNMANVWNNPERKASWSQLIKLNLGVVYRIKKTDRTKVIVK